MNNSIETLIKVINDTPVDLGAEATLRKIIQDTAISGPLESVAAMGRSLADQLRTASKAEAEKN